ncbi:Na+/H+ antiporter subunit E [Dinoroseobacter sp. PD6]|uniref:Na+/H+ antiporter subunit E n=1 Tax=Dinoroseobacter sp. PD6 TaxID=3028384 RepID=UPI00237C4D3B|nr:Na+/H+ antiporter subunit E [Dinoroseobacter sp. PD6]MDD9718262.1 Na+/H+ antiporter subunit E [Dinoroseobacter sp. PD6]
MKLVLRIYYSINLFVYFLYELVVSSVQVAWDVLTPEMKARPVLVVVPLDAKTDLELMLTANIISLTPGTLSIDLSADRTELLVHSMFGAKDPEGEIAAMKHGIERRVLRATRGVHLA